MPDSPETGAVTTADERMRLFRHLPEAVLLLDGALRVRWANGAAQLRYGISSFPLCPVADLVPDFVDRMAFPAPGMAIEPLSDGWAVIVECLPEMNPLARLLDLMPAPVFYKDRQGRYLGGNAAFCAMLGIAKADLVGKTVFDLSPPDQARRYREMDEALFRQGPGGVQHYEFEVRDRHGVIRETLFHKANFLDADGQVAGLVGVISDISELRASQRRADLAGRRLCDAIGAISEGFALFDAQDRLAACNIRYLDLFPCLGGVEQAVGMSFDDITRRVVESGLIDTEGMPAAVWIAKRSEAHRHPGERPFLQRMSDGRWLRISEQRTADGGSVGVRTDITDIMLRGRQLEEARAQAEFLAYHDALTGLANRRLLRDRMAAITAQARRRRNSVVVLYADLDGFKDINDSFGHNAGDEVLRTVAQGLLSCVRESDTVARLGGDEFVIVGEVGRDARAEAVRMAERILEHCRRKGGDALFDHISVSIGIALFPEHHHDIDGVLSLADRALYQAKRKGKNRYVIHGEEDWVPD